MKQKHESEHTPTPWILTKYETGYGIEIIESNLNIHPVHGQIAFVDKEIGSASYPNEALANARFIISACNTHDTLLNAARCATVNSTEHIGDFVLIRRKDYFGLIEAISKSAEDK